MAKCLGRFLAKEFEVKTFWIILSAVSFAALLAQADRALPVGADDMARADALLGQSEGRRQDGAHKPSTIFGKTVSEEAKALKDADEDTRKAFGNTTASQRRQNGSHSSPNANLGNSIGTGGSSDPRSHIPPQGDVSSGKGRPSSPGKK
jgi:hypothetical protein